MNFVLSILYLYLYKTKVYMIYAKIGVDSRFMYIILHMLNKYKMQYKHFTGYPLVKLTPPVPICHCYCCCRARNC